MAEQQELELEEGQEQVVEKDETSSKEERGEASSLGWVDKPDYRGDKSKWVDAKTFVDKGRHILPIVQENNKRMKAELAEERRQRKELEEAVRANTESMHALEEFYAEETNRRVKEVRIQVLKQLKEAKTNQDVDAEVVLTGELTKLDAEAAQREADGKGDAKTGKGAPAGDGVGVEQKLSPEFLQWQADNADWWGSDKVKTQRAWLIAQELRLDSGNDHLLGRAFFDKVEEELDNRYGKGGQRPGTTKVESSRGGGTSRGAGDKNFGSLPKEARDACHSWNSRLVGPNKAHKTIAEWEAAYVKSLPAEYWQGAR